MIGALRAISDRVLGRGDSSITVPTVQLVLSSGFRSGLPLMKIE